MMWFVIARPLAMSNSGAGAFSQPLGDVFADPGFVVAQAVGRQQQVQIPVVRIRKGTMRWMSWHHE